MNIKILSDLFFCYPDKESAPTKAARPPAGFWHTDIYSLAMKDHVRRIRLTRTTRFDRLPAPPPRGAIVSGEEV